MNIDLKEVRKYANKESVFDADDRRARTEVNSVQLHNMNFDEVLNLLKETKSLHDEADVLHFLYETK
jgi:hypothetical protein